ncbi:MAG: hypothetical protein ABI999_17135 [Acidobacteriota bacterium]
MDSLTVLEGKKLDAVMFVQDYLQLQLESFLVTYLSFPHVIREDHTHVFGDAEYRNRICEFIGEVVSSVTYVADQTFSLDFSGKKIECSLSPDVRISPEIVTIRLENGDMIVF